MNFEDLKDQLKDNWARLRDRVEESPSYNNIRERYQNLTPNVQKMIVIGTVCLTTLLVFSVPFSFLSSSSSYLQDYEQNKQLIRDLLRIGREAKTMVSLPPSISASQLEGRVQNVLNSANLLPEQITSIRTITSGKSSLSPKQFQQQGVAVQLAKLNVKQIVDISYSLQSLNSSIKLTAMDITANAENDHYYNVIFKLFSFSLPQEDKPNEKDQQKSRRRSRN